MTERPRIEARRINERPHVLVVTDDSSLAEFLGEGLPLGGFWVSIIASGLQALEVFRLRQFDLVLIDMELQSFRAEELIRRLRGQSNRVEDATPRTLAPIVIVTTEKSELSAIERQQLAISDVMEAPIEIDEIVRRLHSTFQHWRQDNPDTPLADASSASLAR